MIWDDTDQWAMRRILREMFTEERLAPPLPRTLHPHPRHQTALVHPPTPIARTRLGSDHRPPTPAH